MHVHCPKCGRPANRLVKVTVKCWEFPVGPFGAMRSGTGKAFKRRFRYCQACFNSIAKALEE